MKKARLALFVNNAVGVKIYFIGFQATYYHTDTKRLQLTCEISINLDNPNSDIATIKVMSTSACRISSSLKESIRNLFTHCYV